MALGGAGSCAVLTPACRHALPIRKAALCVGLLLCLLATAASCRTRSFGGSGADVGSRLILGAGLCCCGALLLRRSRCLPRLQAEALAASGAHPGRHHVRSSALPPRVSTDGSRAGGCAATHWMLLGSALLLLLLLLLLSSCCCSCWALSLLLLLLLWLLPMLLLLLLLPSRDCCGCRGGLLSLRIHSRPQQQQVSSNMLLLSFGCGSWSCICSLPLR
jgi:hypothetical protein